MTRARFDPATTSVCAQVFEMPPSIQKRWPSRVGPMMPGSEELAATAWASGIPFLSATALWMISRSPVKQSFEVVNIFEGGQFVLLSPVRSHATRSTAGPLTRLCAGGGAHDHFGLFCRIDAELHEAVEETAIPGDVIFAAAAKHERPIKADGKIGFRRRIGDPHA